MKPRIVESHHDISNSNQVSPVNEPNAKSSIDLHQSQWKEVQNSNFEPSRPKLTKEQ